MTLSLKDQYQFTIRCWRYLGISFNVNFANKPSITELRTELEKQVVKRIQHHYRNINERTAFRIMEDASVTDFWNCDVSYNNVDVLPEPDLDEMDYLKDSDTAKILKWLSTEEDSWSTPHEVRLMSAKVLEAFN